jgi:macrolide export ATP-binding/permease protein macB
MANKMRSGLSTLGIIIGMTSVVVMMAIGQGTENSITKTMGDMAKNKISISSNG